MGGALLQLVLDNGGLAGIKCAVHTGIKDHLTLPISLLIQVFSLSHSGFGKDWHGRPYCRRVYAAGTSVSSRRKHLEGQHLPEYLDAIRQHTWARNLLLTVQSN
ncbi:hypothetical protein B0H14DRAFT_3442680 [Mycena olivaceomarginata]|nr:hypothetical protein B0H14DRAFT_3442680 [Mycena olivaceomarginata]